MNSNKNTSVAASPINWEENPRVTKNVQAACVNTEPDIISNLISTTKEPMYVAN